MKIRRAQTFDCERIQEIINPYLGPAFNWPPESFQSEFAFAETWVLEVKGQLEAFVCVRNAISAWEISVLGTRKESRKMGFMKKLLSGVIDHYGRKRQFWLEVHEANQPAQSLYKSMGFQFEGRRGGYYQDGSSALLLTLSEIVDGEI
jgi:ribosomal-protein-alanine N-acetyltransferase